ncbi:hypothetical protein GCM10023094_36830 [Rhodococcus olei]|uniref:Uncharacterized protein n=1 Tax=Rhodococcus olei TaxID=2161675 RepID=A0ABP8PCW8_9NOCA
MFVGASTIWTPAPANLSESISGSPAAQAAGDGAVLLGTACLRATALFWKLVGARRARRSLATCALRAARTSPNDVVERHPH